MDNDSQYWEAINRISTHEAMCEERSKTIFNRLDKIDEKLEGIGKTVFVLGMTIITGMAGLIATLLLR
jgi:hypothetical protein|tara:strand:+ start:668 stop:871 length:204 start_codon:yes stop_codon:yes gene_type:complete